VVFAGIRRWAVHNSRRQRLRPRHKAVFCRGTRSQLSAGLGRCHGQQCFTHRKLESRNTAIITKAGYQDIEGQNVAKNRRIEVNAGSYFKIYRNKAGELTVGLNMTGMHYDKNLRYFHSRQAATLALNNTSSSTCPRTGQEGKSETPVFNFGQPRGSALYRERITVLPNRRRAPSPPWAFLSTYTNTSGNYNLSVRTIYQSLRNG